MIIDYLLILVTLVIINRQYKSGYTAGLVAAIYFLVLLPKTLTIDISIDLPSLTVHRFIITLMFIKWINNHSIQKRLSAVPFIKIFTLILITSGISALISINMLVSMKRYMYFFAESYVFYIIISTSLKDLDSVLSVIKAETASLTISAILAAIEKWTQYNIFKEILAGKQRYEFEADFLSFAHSAGDVIVSFEHRILMGVAMAVGMINALFLIEWTSDFKKKYYSVCFLILGTALYFSNSRGPWLAFMGASGFASLLGYKPIIKKMLLIICFVSVVFMIRPGVYQTIVDLYDASHQKGSVKESSYEWRYQVWHMAYDKVTNANSVANVLFGHGQGSYSFLTFPKVQITSGDILPMESWDNGYALILLQYGYIGLILYAIFYTMIFMKGFRSYLRIKDSRKDFIMLTLLIAILFIFMHSNVDIFAPQVVYLEYLNIALLGIVTSTSIPEKVYTERIDPAAII